MDGTPMIDPVLEQDGRTLAATWSPADFEAALPLFVGGDLDPLEVAAVRAFVAAHPERAVDVEAAHRARGAWARAAAPLASLDEVDLWPGIRDVLHAEGRLGAREGAPRGAGLVRFGGARGVGAEKAAPALPRRRFAASGLAAAAALLCTAGLAWLLGFDGRSAGAARGEAALDASHSAVAAAGAVEALIGSGSMNLVGRTELPQGVIQLGAPLGPPLESHAIEVDLGSYHPEVGFPIGGHAARSAALVGGLEAAPRVELLVPRPR